MPNNILWNANFLLNHYHIKLCTSLRLWLWNPKSFFFSEHKFPQVINVHSGPVEWVISDGMCLDSFTLLIHHYFSFIIILNSFYKGVHSSPSIYGQSCQILIYNDVPQVLFIGSSWCKSCTHWHNNLNIIYTVVGHVFFQWQKFFFSIRRTLEKSIFPSLHKSRLKLKNCCNLSKV